MGSPVTSDNQSRQIHATVQGTEEPSVCTPLASSASGGISSLHQPPTDGCERLVDACRSHVLQASQGPVRCELRRRQGDNCPVTAPHGLVLGRSRGRHQKCILLEPCCNYCGTGLRDASERREFSTQQDRQEA